MVRLSHLTYESSIGRTLRFLRASHRCPVAHDYRVFVQSKTKLCHWQWFLVHIKCIITCDICELGLFYTSTTPQDMYCNSANSNKPLSARWKVEEHEGIDPSSMCIINVEAVKRKDCIQLRVTYCRVARRREALWCIPFVTNQYLHLSAKNLIL